MEESIYSKCTRLVKDGARFKVDFKERSLKVGGKYYIKDGEFTGKLGVPKMATKNVLTAIERKYGFYYHSVPSERSESKRRRYFTALPEHELSDDDMMYGIPRDMIQFRLEAFVLIAIVLGYLRWDEMTDDPKHWYWQSEEFPSLIILKEWVVGA